MRLEYHFLDECSTRCDGSASWHGRPRLPRQRCSIVRRAVVPQRHVVAPLNMLVVGRDHKLFYEAYADHSDLDGDGTLDIGYTGFDTKADPMTSIQDRLLRLLRFVQVLHVQRRNSSRPPASTPTRRARTVERRLAQLPDDSTHRCAAQGAVRRQALHRHEYARHGSRALADPAGRAQLGQGIHQCRGRRLQHHRRNAAIPAGRDIRATSSPTRR